METYGTVAVPRIWHWKQENTMTIPTDPQLPLIWESLGKSSQTPHQLHMLAAVLAVENLCNPPCSLAEDWNRCFILRVAKMG